MLNKSYFYDEVSQVRIWVDLSMVWFRVTIATFTRRDWRKPGNYLLKLSYNSAGHLTSNILNISNISIY